MKSILIGLVLLLSVGCKNSDPTTPEAKILTVTYTENTEDFPNPERGFYRYSETSSSTYDFLNLQELKAYRTSQTISGATYQVASTLIFRYYVLSDFVNAPLSASFLANMKTDFQTARQAGVKLIPRFTYTTTTSEGSCPEQFICLPYGDAAKAVVLNHIAQLKPLFQENADVIACLQMGFIGIWGEQYYTDHFGDASSNGQSKLLDANWTDRLEVLKALLDALPKDRMVQVRYPQLKQRYAYGVQAPTSSSALSEGEAFSETDKARMGYHNDCYLSSSNDVGTYEDYGNSATPRKDANTALRNYFAADSKFVAVGGETCSDAYSPQNDCEPAGKAEKEFSNMHYSFLNSAYNNDVNNDWVTGGCMDRIRRNLGYRFVLKTAELPDKVQADKPLVVKIALENVGYASPYNPRPVRLVLRHKTSGQLHSFDFVTDIRKWFTGPKTLEGSFTLPAIIEAGEYELLLNLPDKYTSLASKPEYSIRLANQAVWEEATGFNKLNHSLQVMK